MLNQEQCEEYLKGLKAALHSTLESNNENFSLSQGINCASLQAMVFAVEGILKDVKIYPPSD